MLHKLALVTTYDTPSMIKEAMPTPAEEAAMKARLEQKAKDLMAARGIDIPLVETERWNPDVIDPKTGKKGVMEWDMKPDTDNVRANHRAEATAGVAEGVAPDSKLKSGVGKTPGVDPKAPVTGVVDLESNPNAGKATSKQHVIPGGSVNPHQGSALVEKEIQQAHGTVSNSPAKKFI